ncbi:GNAT family N-acetyltransferase [Brachybacterium saurashtrense]|uniref:N-acetyltransferase n=1 Tax=Brachybacterium saurashtrense TaxID=556288 RepID=A0A345YN23_9MICO|nr:GNAT family protein [Brachybacterium saurashtrense]AXK45325.1 N-acetyltransferase [Brachybacterium saurashtrense]RRR21918.1 N-acetyltransferase [Brachybacterium saurashtrense]
MTRTLADLDWPLHTAHLTLRPGRSEDAEAVWPWYRLPAVQEYTTTLSLTLADHQAWWDRTLDSCVVGEQEGRIVAAGKVERQDAWSQDDVRAQAAGQQAEIGWVLDPAVHGRGLGTAFAAALRDIALEGLGVRRIEAGCFAENRASRRVMEKIGMRLEGVFREDSLHRSGRWLDGASYALLANERRPRR